MANYYGDLSDRKGRRIVMKVSMVGGIITFTSAVFILEFHTTLNAYVLLIMPVIRGLLANETILFSTANAYLSDCTTAENR
jgi:MFS family permease